LCDKEQFSRLFSDKSYINIKRNTNRKPFDRIQMNPMGYFIEFSRKWPLVYAEPVSLTTERYNGSNKNRKRPCGRSLHKRKQKTNNEGCQCNNPLKTNGD